MFKSGCILVILVIGYSDIKRVQLATLPKDVEVFSKELMSSNDEFLPLNAADEGYQNDENVDNTEGSGSDSISISEIGEEIEPPIPEVVENSIEKEMDQDVVKEPEEEQETSKDKEEERETITDNEEELKNTSVEKEEDENDKPEETDAVKLDEDNEDIPVQSAEPSVEENDEDTNVDDNTSLENEEKINPDTIDDQINDDSTNITEEEQNQDNDEDKVNIDIQDPSNNNSPAGNELEPPEENITQDNNEDKEERTADIKLNAEFPNEKALFAERLDKPRGVGKSLPLSEGATNASKEELPLTDVEPKGHDDNNKDSQGDKKENLSLPEPADKNRNIDLEEPKEIEDGASEASSSSNTVTFVIILGIVGLVGIVGYFIHKRRKNHQRATAVPTHEDRELKEVKTHRIDDDDERFRSGQKCHIPEENPLILTNNHLKGSSSGDTEVDQLKNGQLTSNQQEKKLLTALLPTNDQTGDGIPMMDDDAEYDKVVRIPLVSMSTFKSPSEQNESKKGEGENEHSTTAAGD